MHYRLYAFRVFTNDWPASYRFYADTMGLPEKFSDETMGFILNAATGLIPERKRKTLPLLQQWKT